MASPNPQLEAALTQFAAQPGTTPDQEAQLRAAVIAASDADSLRQRSRAALLALCCTLLVTACAVASESLQPAQEAAAMTAPESTLMASTNPTLSAEEIGKRFLKLLEGLESREDLSLEQVQNVLGVTLKRFRDPQHPLYGHSQPLDDGWYFSVDYLPESPSNLRGVSLDFGKPGGGGGLIPAGVCTLDFDYYHNALKAMGFIAQQYYGEHNLFLGWRYTKFNKSDGTVDMTISIMQMVGNKPGHLCVKSIGTLNGR